MKSVSGFVGAIGQTPLILLKTISERLNRQIYAKAEFMNPGGSVKDRAAHFMLLEAERKGHIRPGGTVVEGTAGNTGIGLAHVCNAKGYQCVIYVPNTQSKEKIDLLRTLGAKVFPVPAVPYEDQNNYNHQSRRHAESLENALWLNQFDNTANADGHFISTGPEIYEQLPDLNAFICATGTGGTLSGIGRYLKMRNEKVKIYLADPPGSVLYDYIKTGKLNKSGSSVTEGIGQGRITDNTKQVLPLIEDAFQIPDSLSIQVCFELLAKEGLFVGLSTALNVAAAIEVAKQLPPKSKVVTILCDGGYRYQSRLFNKKWLQETQLYQHIPQHYQHFVQ